MSIIIMAVALVFCIGTVVADTTNRKNSRYGRVKRIDNRVVIENVEYTVQ